jgi:hypothetical protein
MTTRTVQIFLAPDDMIGSFELYRDEALEQVRTNRPHYRLAGMIETNLVGEDAAEMVFGLANESSKEAVKESMGWVGRSFSVGDIVVVDGAEFVCLPVGWKIL